MIPLSLAGAVTAFRWARESFGETSAWIALVLWTFDPNILGNGALVAPDLGGSSMGLVAGYLLWRWLGQPNWSRAFFAGGGLGLALLSKSTLLILGPLWVVSWGVYRWRQGDTACPLEAGSTTAGARADTRGVFPEPWVWIFRDWHPVRVEFVSRTFGGDRPARETTGNRFRGTLLEHVPVPLPRGFLIGLDLQKKDFEVGRWAFLPGSGGGVASLTRPWRGSIFRPLPTRKLLESTEPGT